MNVIAKLSFVLLFLFLLSSATLQVSDDVSTVFCVAYASECHGISWGETRRTLEPLVKVTVCPFDGSFRRKRSRVGEAFA